MLRAGMAGAGIMDNADLIEKGIVAKPPRYSGKEKDRHIWCVGL